MTDNNHPITPPDELVEQWMTEIWHEGTPVRVAASDLHIATQATRWGADQELEACCNWVDANFGQEFAQNLRLFRRPKPPSLKEQALSALYAITSGADDTQEFYQDIETIKKALDSLPD